MGFLYWLNPLNWFRKRNADEPATTKAPAKAEAPAKAAAKTTAKAETKAPAAPAKTTKAAAKTADKEYRPQCAALTSGGDQCRNSARAGSKYCGSHKGYQPPSAKNVQAKKDTAPASKKAADTKPGEKADGSAQCAAITASGVQCKRSAREGSKYCSSHKGYRHASDASKVKKADTKPRHAGAADTKPAVRKSSTCAAKTASGSACKRAPAGRSKYCAQHKGYRA